MQHDLVHIIGGDDVIGRDLPSRELAAPHDVENPAHLLARHHRRIALAADLTNDLRRASATTRIDEMARAFARNRALDESAARATCRVGYDRRFDFGIDRTGEGMHCVSRQPVADLSRLGVAHEYVVHDLVVAARA